VLALLDTNCDPDDIDYIIPGNDDALRSIKLLVTALADAVAEGQAMRKPDDYDEGVADEIDYSAYTEDEEEDDERYLGASTLAKLRDSKLFDEEDKDDDDEGDKDE
jgi:small subunit ribosomal protein S2